MGAHMGMPCRRAAHQFELEAELGDEEDKAQELHGPHGEHQHLMREDGRQAHSGLRI